MRSWTSQQRRGGGAMGLRQIWKLILKFALLASRSVPGWALGYGLQEGWTLTTESCKETVTPFHQNLHQTMKTQTLSVWFQHPWRPGDKGTTGRLYHQLAGPNQQSRWCYLLSPSPCCPGCTASLATVCVFPGASWSKQQDSAMAPQKSNWQGWPWWLPRYIG